MRMFQIGIVLVLVGMLSGCGSLRAPLVANRDLTPNEVAHLEKSADDFVCVPIPMIFFYMKILKDEFPGLRMCKMTSVLHILPYIGPGYARGVFADYSHTGQLLKSAHATELAPLFSRCKVLEYNQGEKPKPVLTSTSFLKIFGWGQVNGDHFVRIVVPIGADKEDIKDVMPEKLSITKQLR